jgi:hypothetical protein
MAYRGSKSKKTAFVPKIVFRAAVVGVGAVPVCAALATGCSNNGSPALGVAAECFCADGGGYSTACCRFLGNDAGVADGGFGDVHVHPDASVADAAFRDVVIHPDVLGVADIGFVDVADAGDGS